MPVTVSIAGNRTLGDLKARIADELARNDLASQIALAIEDAITEAATHRFWFNEVTGLTFPAIVGQDIYGSPDLDAMTEIDEVWFTPNGQRQQLRLVGDAVIDGYVQGTATNSQPYLYSRRANGLRLYPTPDKGYVIRVDGSTRFPPMLDDLDWNGWTTHGERYIRALAKREIYATIIRDSDEAQVQDALATRYRDELLSATYDRVATRQVACNG